MTTEKVVERSLPSIVAIDAGDKSGTGFIANGMVYTCFHVMSGSKEATVTFHDGTKAPVLAVLAVLAADPDRDIAVLFVAVGERPSLKLGDYSAVGAGSKAIVIGNPLGLTDTVTEGIVSAKRTLTSKDVLQLSAGISPGSSGSPVINDLGLVIGMVTSSIEGGQTLNLAISGKDIKQTLGVSLIKAFASERSSAGEAEAEDLGVQKYADPSLLSTRADELQGITSLGVLVESVKENLGVSKSDLELWTTLAVRSAGIRVRLEDENLAKPFVNEAGLKRLKEEDDRFRYIYVNINSLRTQDGLTVYSMDVEIDRQVILYPGF